MYISVGRQWQPTCIANVVRLLLLPLWIAVVGWAQQPGKVVEALTYLGGERDLAVTLIALGPENDVYVAGRTGRDLADIFVARLDGDLRTLRYFMEFGGSNLDEPRGLAVDRAGACHIAGITLSGNFPATPGAFSQEPPSGAGQVFGFLVKLDPDGEIAYSTFFPEPEISDVAVDSEGRAILVGTTRNPDFPVTSDALRTTLRPAVCTRFCKPNFFLGGLNCFDTPCADGYIARFVADGSGLDYASYLGADPVDPLDLLDQSRAPDNEGDDRATAVEVDSNGHIVVAGTTNSTRFPVTAGAYQQVVEGDRDLFVMKLDPTGRTLLASTLLGGEGTQEDPKLAVDRNGDFHLVAASFAPELFGVVLDPEGTDSFVAKLSGDGARLLYQRPVGAGFGVRHRSPTLTPLRVGAMPDGATLVVTPGPFETTPRRVCVASTHVTQLASDDGHVEFSAGQPFFGLETAIGEGGAVYMAGASFEAALSAATTDAYQTEPRADTTSVVSRVSTDPQTAVQIDCMVNAASRGVWPKNFGGIPPDAHRTDAIVSPGELVTFFGTGLGPEQGFAFDAGASVLPLELGGTRIRVGGEPSGLLYSQASQVNAAAPFSLFGSRALFELEGPNGASVAFWIPVVHANPGVFTADYSGTGQAVIRNANGSGNSVTNPAPAGSVITFYTTGLGRTALPETSGIVNPEARNVLPIPRLRVDIGGIEAECPEVNTAPGLPAGVYEFHCRIPEQLEPGGGHWVDVFVGPDAASQIRATIAVQ